MTSRYDHLPITTGKVGLPDYRMVLDNDDRCWEVGTTKDGKLARRRLPQHDPAPGLREALQTALDHQPSPETLRLVECASRVRCTRYTETCHYHHHDIRQPCSTAGPIHSDICHDWAGIVSSCDCYRGNPPPADTTADQYRKMLVARREAYRAARKSRRTSGVRGGG